MSKPSDFRKDLKSSKSFVGKLYITDVNSTSSLSVCVKLFFLDSIFFIFSRISNSNTLSLTVSLLTMVSSRLRDLSASFILWDKS